MGRAALLPPAAFAVHQLRYEIAFGSGAGAELRRTGHSYLHSAVPWIVLLLALAVGSFVGALGRAFRGHTSAGRYTTSLAALWLACSAALITIFTCQEFLEGLFVAGHPAGVAGMLAAILHGARWILDEVSRRWSRPRARSRRAAAAVRAPLVAQPRRLAPLADGWSGRGPPAEPALTI
jgi:hypothetical protein